MRVEKGQCRGRRFESCQSRNMRNTKPVQPEVGNEYEVSCGLGNIRMRVTDLLGTRVYGELTRAHDGYLTRSGRRYGSMRVGFKVSMHISNAVFRSHE